MIVTFNTEGPNAGPSPVVLPGAVAINPLNLVIDETPAASVEHMGATFFDDANGRRIETIPQVAYAQLDTQKGVLVVTNMKTPTSDQINLEDLGRWPQGVYHRYDYAFWWNNLRATMADRIQAFLG